jgi:phosphatidate cytidylyltransferase
MPAAGAAGVLAARFITAALLLAVCIAAMFWLPNQWWAAALLVVTAAAAWEWGALAGYGRVLRWIFCGAILFLAVGIYLAIDARRVIVPDVELEFAVYMAACVFWLVVAPLWLARRWRVEAPLWLALTGFLVLIPAWLAIARLQLDPLQLLQLLGIVWLADTAAYLTGRSWGKRKLAPQISPGKTWEGVAGAVVAVAVYYVVLSSFTSARSWTIGWGGVLVFAGVAALSIVGDLFESWMKRRAGVKDSGALLPGHGGVFDRIDGLTASMPFAALLTRYLA